MFLHILVAYLRFFSFTQEFNICGFTGMTQGLFYRFLGNDQRMSVWQRMPGKQMATGGSSGEERRRRRGKRHRAPVSCLSSPDAIAAYSSGNMIVRPEMGFYCFDVIHGYLYGYEAPKTATITNNDC